MHHEELARRILKLKRERDAVILAHSNPRDVPVMCALRRDNIFPW